MRPALPTLVASANADVGMLAGIEILRAGGRALDAVEAVTRLVEANEADHTVGIGGWPNLLGEVELDASIIDGTTRQAGAVGALRGYRHPISVARAVMERLPHVLLAGAGAERFAHEIGAEPAALLTATAEAGWRERVRLVGLEHTLGRAGVDPGVPLADAVGRAVDPALGMGTVDVIAIDGKGHVASAVSTSGWSWKYPGRVGDSPLVGAGNYADGRHGAAACTGFGELAIRSGAARLAVSGLAAGLSPEAAGRAVLDDVAALDVQATSNRLRVIVVAADGRHAALTNVASGGDYVFWTPEHESFVRSDRLIHDVRPGTS